MKCTVSFAGYSELLAAPQGLGGRWVMYIIVLNEVSSFGTKDRLTMRQIYWLCPSVFVVALLLSWASVLSLTSSSADCGRF
jgi:hypothetical protein